MTLLVLLRSTATGVAYADLAGAATGETGGLAEIVVYRSIVGAVTLGETTAYATALLITPHLPLLAGAYAGETAPGRSALAGLADATQAGGWLSGAAGGGRGPDAPLRHAAAGLTAPVPVLAGAATGVAGPVAALTSAAGGSSGPGRLLTHITPGIGGA